MGVFRFKRFSVRNDLSAMKVNTDGVLLGAASIVRKTDARVLDVGTGTGTIALMIAQRLSDLRTEDSTPFRITGIDIDGPSVGEASLNFAASEWSGSLEALHCSLQDYPGGETFDLIISNPPYFEGDLEAPSVRRNAARHSESSLSYAELLYFSSERLNPGGRLSLIMPYRQECRVLREASSLGLHPMRLLRVRTTSAKPFTRTLADFSLEKPDLLEEELTMKIQGSNTLEYDSLVSDFYLSSN